MIIVLKKGITDNSKKQVLTALRMKGISFHEIEHNPKDGTIIAARGKLAENMETISILPGVANIIPDKPPFKLASRDEHREDSHVRVGPVEIGTQRLVIIAGPCAVESREQAFTVAREVRKYGALIFRAGAFKPRSSPYSFQGLGEEGLKILADIRKETGMPVVSEIVSTSHADIMVKYIDMLQIGARNMQNFDLLKCVGRLNKPVLLKRGPSATIEEWLMSAEYIMSEGNNQVVLCERGIRTFEPYTRNTLDLSAIPVLKNLTHLPVIIDPSHATGIREKVAPMARASIAAGADGIIIEVHNEPDKALSDGPQSLLPEQFGKLMRDIYMIAPVVGRQVDFAYLEKAKVIKNKASTRKGSKVKTAFCGETGTTAHKACTQYFGSGTIPMPTRSYREIFDAVTEGLADYAVIPLHNSLSGSVHENYDLLLEYNLQIVGEITLRVVHNLATQPGINMTDIKRVFSEPSVFRQCRQYLDAHPDWEQVAARDTTSAARQVKEGSRSEDAVITTLETAEFYGLTILEEGIETNPRNYTRFVVIAQKQLKKGSKRKSSIVYQTVNRPGALYETLRVFSDYGINLVKLESRAVEGEPSEWMFYVDLEADIKSPKFEPVLNELKEHVDYLKVLGRY